MVWWQRETVSGSPGFIRRNATEKRMPRWGRCGSAALARRPARRRAGRAARPRWQSPCAAAPRFASSGPPPAAGGWVCVWGAGGVEGSDGVAGGVLQAPWLAPASKHTGTLHTSPPTCCSRVAVYSCRLARERAADSRFLICRGRQAGRQAPASAAGRAAQHSTSAARVHGSSGASRQVGCTRRAAAQAALTARLMARVSGSSSS